jgi:hypothetical protein
VLCHIHMGGSLSADLYNAVSRLNMEPRLDNQGDQTQAGQGRLMKHMQMEFRCTFESPTNCTD